jgi:hypothetical protein
MVEGVCWSRACELLLQIPFAHQTALTSRFEELCVNLTNGCILARPA